MSENELSILEHLREVAIMLELTQDDAQDIYSLDEREIASIINQHYQGKEIEVTLSLEEKRKGEQEEGRDNKRLKANPKVVVNLSALEKLPNEIYEKILYPLGAKDKNNLRTTCKGLYEKTTLMDTRYNFWCFDAFRGTPPDFVLKSDKKLCIRVLFDEEGDEPNDKDVDNIGIIINKYANKISELRIDIVGDNLIKYLRSMNPVGFTNLTTLDIDSVELDNISLLQLAPQLENLSLFNIEIEFDLSTVNEDDMCFTKLKTLDITCCKIDVCKILSKCCKTLNHLKFHSDDDEVFKELEPELCSLKSLDIYVADGSQKSFWNLLSKSLLHLTVLKIALDYGEKFDFSIPKDINITTLVLEPGRNNIDSFLKKCPKIQNLTLIDYEIKDVVFKDLTKLTFERCDAPCVSNVLKQLSKSTVRTLNFDCFSEYLERRDSPSFEVDELRKCEFSVLPELDTVWVTGCFQDSEIMDKVHKLFPQEVQVKREVLEENRIVFRRFYDL